MKFIALTPAYPPRNAAMTPVVERFIDSLEMPGYVIAEKEVLYKSADSISRIGEISEDKAAYRIFDYRIRLVTKITKAFWPDRWHLWSKRAFVKAARIIRETDEKVLLITFSSPVSSHLQGIRLKKKFPHIKWLAYIADPLVDGILYNKTTKHYREKISNAEKAIVEIADATVTLSKRHHELMKQNYINNGKIHYIQHTYADVPAIEQISEDRGMPLVAHFGNMYPPRSILPFVDSLVKSTFVDKFVFANYGGLTQEDREILKKLPGFVTHKPLPYADFIKGIRSADALVLIEGMNSSSSIALPSKLIEYIGAHRPVFGFCFPGSEGERICHEMGFACANITNPNECVDRMEEFLIGVNSNSHVLSNRDATGRMYSPENVRKTVKALVASLGK